MFLEAVGDNGFAPTAASCIPDTGDLYLSIGGRGTRGAVYRIRYPAGLRTLDPARGRQMAGEAKVAGLAARIAKGVTRRGPAGRRPQARLRALVAIRRHRTHFERSEIDDIIFTNAGHPDRYIRRAVADLLAAWSGSSRWGLAAEHAPGRHHLLPGKLSKSGPSRTSHWLAADPSWCRRCA